MTKTEERRIAFEQAVMDRLTKRGLPEQTVRKHYLLRRDDDYVDVVICEMWDYWNLAAVRAERSGNSGDFQYRVDQWLMGCFGHAIARDKAERNHRFLEEALELVQSTGCTAAEAHLLVDYVFGRPVGDPHQEAGGVKMTLAALCLAHDMDEAEAGEVELTRAWLNIGKIRDKQAAKPKNSPLPVAPAPAVDRCFICAEPLKEGDIVLPDYDGGTGHRACFGEQREGFCNLETGEPLAADEPLPEGYAYKPDPKAAEG